jgi:predicted nucleotidyltransferase
MAKTILESFRELKSNLEITLPQQSTISTRQQNVRKAVEEDMEVLSSFLTGSYSRHTMISPLKKSDIDIFMVLNPSYYYDLDGPASLLDKVKRVLKKTYPNTPDISRNGQAVTIQFTDFMVDVVPGFDRKGGGYLIPNSITGKWIPTDPKKHVEIIANANSIHNDNLVPLIKMVKGWNKNINTYFQSFHLEVLSLQILDNVKISNFPSGMRYFFDKGRNLISKKNPDPAGYGEDVGVYINTQEKIQEAVAKFQLAYDRAIKAEDYERQGYIEDAIEMWKIIFGDYFPAYG